jgi:hypothetical protein
MCNGKGAVDQNLRGFERMFKPACSVTAWSFIHRGALLLRRLIANWCKHNFFQKNKVLEPVIFDRLKHLPESVWSILHLFEE